MTATRTSDASAKTGLPADVYTALVGTLFGTIGSFVSGVIGGLLVPVIAWGRTGDPIFLGCTAVILAFSAFRVMVLLAHRRAAQPLPLEEAKRWEQLYAVGGVGFMTSVGITAALLFYLQRDLVTTVYGVVITMACVGQLAGRNAGRPMIVLAQSLGLCAPVATVMLLHQDIWYWGLAAIMVLIVSSTKSTTKFINGIIVSALLTGREASIQRAQFAAALDSMSHGLCMGDKDGVITVSSRRLREFFNLDLEGEPFTAPVLAERIAKAGGLSQRARRVFVETWSAHIAKRDSSVFNATLDGRIYDFRCEPMQDGGFVVVVEDVTAERLASREIERMAHFDSLTGLPNRIQFHNRMEACFAHPPASGTQLALLSIDLDQFKEVNDTRGHPTGDELLRLVAQRLRRVVQANDLVARFGGDEFQVLIQCPPDMADVESIAQRIIDTLSASYSVDGNSITIGASVGIARAPEDADSADELLRCSDMALYQAKADGRGVYRVFAPEMDKALRHKREVEDYLRTAIERDTLELHYQPVVDTRREKIVACEALVRLRHPTKGLIPPGEFISVAEETGLIMHLGEWVLRRACRDAVCWPSDVRVAVNFSPKQFVLGKNVVADIQAALEASGLPPERLEVEITESTIIEAKDALQQLRDISALGVKISLDDFGTGYSSLSYLRLFPVDKIKIDRAFAQDVNSRASQAVIGSVSVLAQLLNVELVIEGVEQSEQLDAIKPWNVHLVQGYYFSRPRPLPELLLILSGSTSIVPLRKVA